MFDGGKPVRFGGEIMRGIPSRGEAEIGYEVWAEVTDEFWEKKTCAISRAEDAVAIAEEIERRIGIKTAVLKATRERLYWKRSDDIFPETRTTPPTYPETKEKTR